MLTSKAQRKLKLAQKPYQLPFTKTKSLHKDLSHKDKRLELFRNLLQQAQRNVPPGYPSGRQRRFLRLVPELRHHVPSISFESQINKAYVSADENDIDLDLASTPYEVLRTGAELVIQNYIQYVWLTVGQRLDGFTRNGKYNQTKLKKLLRSLSPNEADGLEGLSYSMVEKVLGSPPRVVAARLASRNGPAVFTEFQSDLWYDRLGALFGWDDLPGARKRRFDQAPFRRLLRSLHQIIETELGEDFASRFLQTVQSAAAHHLWIIPQFDVDHFSVLYKAKHAHRQATRDRIAALPTLQRISWLSCRFADSLEVAVALFDPESRIEGDLDHERAIWRPQLNAIARTACLGLYVEKINRGHSFPMILNPADIGIELRLSRAMAFEKMCDNLSEGSTTCSDSNSIDSEN